MARGLSMVGLMMLVAAAVLQCSAAQTTHVVGDSLGWMVPPGGPDAYPTWASMQNFTVGDFLIFNFTTGSHTVAEVTSAAFRGCDSTNPISISTTGPTNITLTSAGEHFFICTVGQHCNFGQKVSINVSAATTSPSPPPSATPSPPPAPMPTASPPASTPRPSGATPPSTTTSPPPSSTTTPSPPSPAGTTAPPPPDSSAPSSAVAGLPVALLSIALAFL